MEKEIYLDSKIMCMWTECDTHAHVREQILKNVEQQAYPIESQRIATTGPAKEARPHNC